MSGPADTDRVAWWRAMEERYGRSPVHEVFGLSLRVLGAGVVAVDYGGDPAAGNIHGTVSGGAIAQLVDSGVVQACRTLLAADDRAVTVALAVSFVRAARVGTPLSAVGRVVDVGGTLGTARVEVASGSGEVVAIGQGTVRIRRAG